MHTKTDANATKKIVDGVLKYEGAKDPLFQLILTLLEQFAGKIISV